MQMSRHAHPELRRPITPGTASASVAHRPVGAGLSRQLGEERVSRLATPTVSRATIARDFAALPVHSRTNQSPAPSLHRTAHSPHPGLTARNPRGEESADEILTANGGGAAPAGPAPAGPGPAGPAPAAPAGSGAAAAKCTVTSGPSYSPSGTIPVTTAGGRKSAAFSFSASFANATGPLERLGLGIRTGGATGFGIGAYFLGVGAIPGAILGGLIGGIAGLGGSDSKASCCEVRQFIKWDRAFATANGGPPHGGFPAGTAPDTWIEDRDAADKRYGRRSGPFSDPIAGGGDEYTLSGAQDMANGDEYRGRDGPGGPDTLIGQWQFQLKVVDTCDGDAEKASSSVITVNW